MPTRKPITPVRKRPEHIRVMTTAGEKRELQRAAKKLDTPLSKFIRDAALEKARDLTKG